MAKTADKHSKHLGIGIDFGGTGIKGAIVDLRSGELVGSRQRQDTPVGASPADVHEAIRAVYASVTSQPEMPEQTLTVGVCMPAIVRHGTTLSAANIAQEWIGTHARTLFAEALGVGVAVMNDADAAGVAETRFGDVDDQHGTLLVLTLGTGIGSALISNGKLVPNTELGHLDLPDKPDYEKHASAKVRERLDIPFDEWAATLLTPYFRKLEALFSPDAFIISGGVSKRAHEFLPFIDIETPLHAAKLRNNAGIVGAALLGKEGWD